MGPHFVSWIQGYLGESMLCRAVAASGEGLQAQNPQSLRVLLRMMPQGAVATSSTSTASFSHSNTIA